MKALFLESQNFTGPIKIGSHHFAESFSKDGFSVTWFTSALNPFSFLKNRNSALYRLSTWLQGGKAADGITEYSPLALLPNRNLPLVGNRIGALKLFVPSIKSKLKEFGCLDIDLLWICEARDYGHLFHEINHKVSILRMSDAFYISDDWPKNTLFELKSLFSKVDLIVATSKGIFDKCYEEKRKGEVLYLPNGVNLQRFSLDVQSVPAEYEFIPVPRVLYVGTIYDWFSLAFLEQIASDLPHLSFVVIGPVSLIGKKRKEFFNVISRYPNIFFLGPKPNSQVPAYMRNADVGIIPFIINEFTHEVNPVKLYEYMACGLPVVSSRLREVEAMESPAFLADDPEEFVKKIRQAIENPPSKKLLVNFANENSWEHRYKKLRSFIKL